MGVEEMRQPETLAELLSEHGDKVVKFQSYYKYSFCFVGHGITISAGGDTGDDIYRSEISAEMTIEELDQAAEIIHWHVDEEEIQPGERITSLELRVSELESVLARMGFWAS